MASCSGAMAAKCRSACATTPTRWTSFRCTARTRFEWRCFRPR
jgi:hypothetical protein